MIIKYLAVDSDVEFANSEAIGWAAHGIEMERVDNMIDGIKLLTENEYLYVGINGDVVDYMPMLQIMRKATQSPILIATTDFTTEKEVAALRAGANLFALFHKNNQGNIASVLAHIMRINEEIKTPQKIMVYSGLLVAPSLYQVFLDNTEINLTRKEFDILVLLVKNQGDILSPDQIVSHVWGIDDASVDGLQTHIRRIRKKMSDVSPRYKDMIENVHGFGYRFVA